MTTVDFTQLPSTQVGTDEQFDTMSRSTGFLGRLQLYSKNKEVAEGLIPPGTFGIPEGDKKIVKLGPKIDVLPLARRTKALDMSDKEAIIANYDADSDVFKDIAARSVEQESNCMYGTSFLVFERTTGRLLELFCGTKSSRPVAGDIAVFLPLTEAQIAAKAKNGSDVSMMKAHGPVPCTLTARLAKSKKGFSWHIPDVQSCSVPFTNLPSMDKIVDKFVAAKSVETESVKEEPGKKACAR